MAKNKNTDNQTNKTDLETKIRIISIQLLLVIGFIASWKIYLTGNQHIVANTIDANYLFLFLFLIGSIISVIAILKLSPRVDKIQYNYFPATVGWWLLIIPIILTIYSGYYLNLKLSKGKYIISENIIIDKSGDIFMRNYWLIVNYDKKNEKISVSKQIWNKYTISDSISIVVIEGYLGYDIIRYEQWK